MSEIRASHIGAEYDPDRSDPLLVARDAVGVLRPATKTRRIAWWVERGNVSGYEDAIVIEPEVEHA